MELVTTDIPDLLILEPRVFGDARGYFLESFNARNFRDVTGVNAEFVQDNFSRSTSGVLRGLHYQISQPQGKLITVVRGKIYDAAVDLRKSSPTFGRWVGIELSDENHRQFWIPAGFAHGFLVLSEIADVVYKTTDYYAPAHERTIIWNDARLGIQWPAGGDPIVSAKDQVGLTFEQAATFD